jgi:hypothetical protein
VKNKFAQSKNYIYPCTLFFEDINNPCPAGFRVPTQHEWALIGNEGGNSASVSADYFSTSLAGSTPKFYTTWVPVKNAKVNNSWNSGTNEDNNYSDLCGYALCKASDWNSADAGYKDSSLSLAAEGAPEPLMFMSAAGIRPTVVVCNYTGGSGYYWSITANNDGYYGHIMYFYSSNVSVNYHSVRAYGMRVFVVSQR